MYVNGSYRGEDEIGRLMHDFSCSNPEDMYNRDLAKVAKYYKETEEGIRTMCKLLEDMRNEVTKKVSVETYINACKEFGVVDSEELINRTLEKFSFLTEDEAKEFVFK